MIIRKCMNFFKSFIATGASPQKLAASVCFGIYLAFTPFLGLHLALAFFISWFFSLNAAIMLAVSCVIHNPWTVFPIYATDYFCGDYVLLHWFGVNPVACNPCWMGHCNAFLTAHTGLPSVSLWSFLIGGNILGIGLSLMVYPVMKRYFTHSISAWQRKKDEDNNAEQKSLS